MISIGKITHNGMKKVNKIVKIIVEYLTKKIKILTTKNIIMAQVIRDRVPIYYKNAEEMDKPLSELMEDLRMEINKTRGKLNDIKRSYGWEDRIEPLEGGLTCMLIAMYNIMIEFEKYEDKQRVI